jgi:hypothetical protein
MSAVIKKIEGWSFAFGGNQHSGWLPPGAKTPLPTPIEHEVLDIEIEQIEGGYLLIWKARPSPTCSDMRPPKVGDNWLQSLSDALDEARRHFGIPIDKWTDVNV